MSPNDFDWLVRDYDTPLIEPCKKYGCKVAVHCHGRIRHSIKRFIEMGVDQTDPVETIPDGDLSSLSEACRITGGSITFTGNIQMKDLCMEDESLIEERDKNIIRQGGSDHLVVSTTGTPLERISSVLLKNYNKLIETIIDYKI